MTFPIGIPRRKRWTVVGIILAYIVVMAFTRAHNLGDTVDYAAATGAFDGRNWDFGHLWWVPLGKLGQLVTGLEGTAGALRVFLVINWLAGLACVLLLWGFLRAARATSITATVVITGFLFANGFLNWTLTGSAYIPGLAFLLLALYLGTSESDRSLVRSIGMGLALAASICLWFPFVLVAPCVLVTPLVLAGVNRDRLRFVFTGALASGLLLCLAFGLAACSMGVSSFADLRAWVASSSHGVRIGGVARALFGLPRSFIFMGNDGLYLKRFLLKDPYNPVSLFDVFCMLSLWKSLFFYLAVLAIGLNLVRTPPGRRILLLLIFGCGPVFLFAVCWQGGDTERYLPLYPLLFLAVAWVLDDTQGWKLARGMAGAFLILVIVVNAWSFSRWVIEQNQRRLTGRVEELLTIMQPESIIVVIADDLVLLSRNPLAAVNLPITSPIWLGHERSRDWQQGFGPGVETVWRKGGDVWLSRRLRMDRPLPLSNWVEGDDRALRWADICGYFEAFEVSEPVGGQDGFVRLLPTARNRELLLLRESAGRTIPAPSLVYN